MTKKPPDLARLFKTLQSDDELKRQAIASAGLDRKLALLRAYQSDRLAQTYADLLADARYSLACRFFLTEIYAPSDFSQRDHDMLQLHRVLARVVPAPMLRTFTETVELNRLTYALDDQMVSVLFDQLSVTDTITPGQYAQAYRLCDNYDARLHQIELIARILTEVGEGARARGVGLALKLARAPAERAGWGELYGFVERGYAALKPMRDIKPFVRTIQQRELRILDEIWARPNAE